MAHGCQRVTNSIKLSALDIGLYAGDVLCPISDIEDGSAKEFSFRSGNNIHDIFVQRIEDNIYAYVNVCPHAGTPLNMEEGKFTEKSGKYFMCHTHGALFQITDGLCVAGPCNGDKLQAIDIMIKNGNIIVV